MAIKMESNDWTDRVFLNREGYSCDHPSVILMRLCDQEATNDPYSWRGGTRTMPTAHDHIIKNFDELRNGQVIDVRCILGEQLVPATPEIVR